MHWWTGSLHDLWRRPHLRWPDVGTRARRGRHWAWVRTTIVDRLPELLLLLQLKLLLQMKLLLLLQLLLHLLLLYLLMLYLLLHLLLHLLLYLLLLLLVGGASGG